MPTIAQHGRWRINVMYHEEPYSTFADSCTYYIEDSTTGKILNTYNWLQNEMLEQSGPVSVSFTKDGRAIILNYHDGSTSIEPLPDQE
jgi:hypothetical protein